MTNRFRATALAAAMFVCASPAFADPVYFVGAQYGSPLRASASAGILIPVGAQTQIDIQPSITHRGLLIDVAAGAGGTRVAMGAGVQTRETLLLFLGLDACATVTRTSKSPARATADSTYAGLTASMTLSVVRLGIGVERRVAGAAGPRATVLTWSAGIRIPFGGKS
jgi:hypothetical protein